MKKQLLVLLLLISPGMALASGGGAHLDKANIDPSNKQSLQRGARTFVNYCMGCHSAKYQRYNRLAKDLEISEDLVIEHLMFTGEKVGDLMDNAMTKADGAKFFGASPPHLTLVARVRGNDWLYTYMRTFYLDDSRPFGVNNQVFDKVGMPHVLVGLQGTQKAVYNEHHEIEHFEIVEAGSQIPEEYDRTVRDLVNFLAYMGEPIKQMRQSLGIKVMLFLLLLLVITYLLKKEYWKDIH